MDIADLLVAQFPGRVYVTVFEAGKAIGYERSSTEQLCRAKQFPMKITKIRARRMVLLTTLAKYIEERETSESNDGRPSAADANTASV
jgi:hypothetical protein